MDVTNVVIQEEDVIKILLEFLSSRNYHVTLRTLEKESCVVNCDWSDEVLFLRELVLDGDFSEVVEFGNSFSSKPSFNHNLFNYIALRQHFIELIYMKSHILGKESCASVEDVMKTLSQLEIYCPNKDEYSNLCWLLTVPDLTTQEEFKNWTLDISRLKCFEDLLDCLNVILPSVRKKVASRKVADTDRLLQLIIKGLFYESCTEYCQSIAAGRMEALKFHTNILAGLSKDHPSNLVSWVQSLPYDVFRNPFEQFHVDIQYSSLTRSPSVLKNFVFRDTKYLSKKKIEINKSINMDNKSQKKANYHRNSAEINKLFQNEVFSSKDVEMATPNTPQVVNDNTSYKIGNDNNSHKLVNNNISHQIEKSLRTEKDVNMDIMENKPINDTSEVEPINDTLVIKPINDTLQSKPIEEPHPIAFEIVDGKTSNQQEEEKKRRAKVMEKLQCLEEKRILRQKELLDGMSNKNNKKEDSTSYDVSHQSLNDKNEKLTPDVHQNSFSMDLSSRSTPITAELSLTSDVNSSGHKKKFFNLPHDRNINGIPNTSTPYKTDVVPAMLKPHIELSDSHKIESQDEAEALFDSDIQPEEAVQDEQGSELDENGKENTIIQDNLVLGPVINGVRRPIAATLLDTSTSQKRRAEPPQEPVNVIPELKGAGPKIKTRDGSKVHLKELIKNKEKDVKPSATHRSMEEDNHHPSSDLDDVVVKYTAVSMLEDAQAVRSVAFHPSGAYYAVGANSKILRICKVAGVNEAKAGNVTTAMPVVFKRPKYHRGSIYTMAWSPDGRLLATGSNDKTIKLLQFDPQNCVQTNDDVELNIHNGTIRELAFVPKKDGLLISGGAGDGLVNVTDVVSQKVIGTLSGHTGNVLTVYAGDGDLVATGGADNTLRLWDLRSQRCIDVVVVGDSSPASVALSGANKYMASGQEDGSILLYDIAAGRTLQNFRLHQSDCRSVRFSPNLDYLLTSSYDSTISLMHLMKNLDQTAPKHYTIARHDDKVIQCRWHPTDNVFLSSSADRTSVLWKAIL